MEKVFGHAWRDKRGVNEESEEYPGAGAQAPETYVDDEHGLQRRHLVDTTLIVHFFGKKGKKELRYEGFKTYNKILFIILI